jgi:hypothetical protein
MQQIRWLTTGKRAPHIRIKENDKINPIFDVMFSCRRFSTFPTWESNAEQTWVQASKLSAQSPA